MVDKPTREKEYYKLRDNFPWEQTIKGEKEKTKKDIKETLGIDPDPMGHDVI